MSRDLGKPQSLLTSISLEPVVWGYLVVTAACLAMLLVTNDLAWLWTALVNVFCMALVCWHISWRRTQERRRRERQVQHLQDMEREAWRSHARDLATATQDLREALNLHRPDSQP